MERMTTHDDDLGRDGRSAPGSTGRGAEDDAGAGDRSDRCGHDEGRAGRRHRRRRHHHHHGGRKERVLHTRISEQLADDIRRLADDLRVPTSNLVRNVLEEVFTMVESVSEDVGELFDDVLDEAAETRERVRRRTARRRERGRPDREGRSERRRRFDDWVERELGGEGGASARDEQAGPGGPQAEPSATPEPDLSDVIGWQPLVLNHDRQCARCGTALARGTEAYLGLARTGLTDTTLCPRCTGAHD